LTMKAKRSSVSNRVPINLIAACCDELFITQWASFPALVPD
jgi:hypothetical protein